MKILMLSIFAPHFFNWTKQLKNSNHEVFWLDIFDSNTQVKEIDFVHQITGWRYKIDYPGRYFVKQRMPGFNKLVNMFNERNLDKIFEQKLKEIRPDVVHSFVMNLSCFPIYEIMLRNPSIKWIYSSWGSDMYYYKDEEKIAGKMKKVLFRMDFMFTDCYRDFKIARDLGFTGEFLGAFPGGGGFDFNEMNPLLEPLAARKIIVIKGYQGKHGRCIRVLEAVMGLQNELRDYKIIVFGANDEVGIFVQGSQLRDWKNLEVVGIIPRSAVVKLMGKSLIYIGNSLSDGMPNTLLEAIIMGAFPIQANPGGATAEIIAHGKNGLLIENPENPEEIKIRILEALRNMKDVEQGIRYNIEKVKPTLEREFIRKQVLERYNQIEIQL